ncbi:phage repressor protein CI [Rahnella sp. EDr1-12]|uniref:phage repressor protein CI n=1 Tax=unclassified Rahnella TaxID=2635087 RepID=UPI003BAD05FB
MRLENAVAADVLERILSAYGFTMQKELSDKLGIAKSNVASWLQRGQVPGNVLVQCALDTGADVQWLVTGVFANANKFISRESLGHSILKGQPLIAKMLQSGGKPVLQRILEAYGFKTQKELSEYLGISTGTISTWVRREFFPGDVVIACALETGVSLAWLSTGEADSNHLLKGNTYPSQPYVVLKKFTISSSILIEDGTWIADASLVTNGNKSLCYVEKDNNSWIVDFGEKIIGNGKWLLNVDGAHDIYTISRIPGNMINVVNGKAGFKCQLDDVKYIGEVKRTIILE